MDFLRQSLGSKSKLESRTRDDMPLPKTPHEHTKKTSDRPTSVPTSRYGPTPQRPMTSHGEHRYVRNESNDDESLRGSQWRVPLSSFENYLASMQHNPSGFAEQFAELGPVGTTQLTYAGKDSLNAAKNTFKNIIPYDDSRVKLLLDDDSCSDYINASHIKGCDSSSGYIASQFPIRKSLNDWWRMIWEKNVVRILFMESPTGDKRNSIWPAEQSDYCEYGSIKVQWTQWTNHGFCSTRKIFMQKERYRRPVKIYEYKATPSDKLADSVTSLVNFHQLVNHERKEDKLNPPLLVCCKLGTGMTGTFICLDRVFRSLQTKNEVEIYHTLKSIREQRMQLVKTVGEYELIHLCILSLIKKGAIPKKEL